MSKALDAGTILEINRETGAKPVVIIRVDWGNGLNVKFYADRDLNFFDTGEPEDFWGVPWPTEWGQMPSGIEFVNIKGILLSISEIRTQWSDGNVGTTGSATITLDDDDESLRIMLNTETLLGVNVTIYQWFEGATPIAQLTKLLAGRASSPVSWDEAAHTLRFDVVPFLRSGQIGFVPSTTDLPNLDTDAVGIPWPVCFGKPKDVPAVLITRGPLGELRKDIDEDDTTFNIKGGKKFPQNQEITLRIGQEVVFGKFTGTTSDPKEEFEVSENVFAYDTNINFILEKETIQNNGRNIDLFTDLSVVARTIDDNDFSNPATFLINNPNDTINVIGMIAYFKRGTEVRHFATVTKQARFRNDINKITCSRSLGILLDTPDKISFAAFPRKGWDTVEPKKRVIKAGTPVHQKDSENGTFVANDLQSIKILRVAAKRKIKIGSTENEREVLTTLPNKWFTVNLANQDLISGRTVTTIKFDILPSFRDSSFTDEIFVSLESNVSNDPALQMPFILQNFSLLNFDESSFGAVNTQLQQTPMDWASLEVRDTLELVQEMAFQARGTLIHVVDRIKFRYLAAQSLGTLVNLLLTDNTNIEENSIVLEHTPDADIKTQMTGKYKPTYFQENESQLIAQNNIDKYGVINEDIDYFAFQQRESVRVSLEFWIGFRSTVWRLIRLSTFLDALALEALDSILVVSDLLQIPTGVFLRAHEVDLNALEDRMTLLLWTPFSVGTNSSSVDAFIDISADPDAFDDTTDETFEDPPPTNVDYIMERAREAMQNSEGVSGAAFGAQIIKGKFPIDELTEDGLAEARIEQTASDINLPIQDPEEEPPEESESDGKINKSVKIVGPIKPTKNEITLLHRNQDGYLFHQPISKWL